MSIWALTLAFWLHMIATIVWIGGLFFQSAVLLPTLLSSSNDEAQARLLFTIRRRFNPLALLSLAILVGTGLVQMSANPQYEGLFAISSAWSAAILAKHVLTFGMLIIAGYQTWVLLPGLERTSLLGSRTADDSAESVLLNQRQVRLIRGNLLLGLAVLALTAVARTA